MKFYFKAKKTPGGYEEGVIESSTQEAAVELLQKNGLLPIVVRAERTKSSISSALIKYYESVSAKELVVFFRQLAILIEARVPIVSSLTAIKDQTANAFLSHVVQEMIGDIEDGMSFSGAMEKHKQVFSPLSINMIRAGEASGNLKKSIEYVAGNIERNYNLSSRVKSALVYPMIVLVVFFIIGFLVISFIIPKLTAIIKELNAEIPWYTKMVIVIGDFMASYWWAVAIVILGFVGAMIHYVKTEEGKKEWDQVKVRLPIFGPVFQSVYVARFAENLSVLLSGGIPIIRALTLVSAVINNVVYEEIFLKAAEEVKKGGNMSSVLRKEALIPPMVTHMVRIGEDSGQIDSVLGHISRFYEQEVEVTTRNLSSLIEPVLMVIIGVAVGFMAFSILMPIYNIAGQIQ